MTIHERLRAARTALGLKQEEMAEQSGVSGRAYQGYEGGRSVPGGDALMGFVHAGINANWLLTGEGPMLLRELQTAGAKEPAQAVDLELMQGLLEMLEEELEKRDRDLGPASKARLVAVLYDCAVKLGALDPSIMRNVLDIAA